MRFKRLVWAVCVMAAAITTLGPPAPPAVGKPADAARVRLGAVNHVTFSRPGVLDVAIPADAVMDFPLSRRNRDVQVEGRGRFVGFLLASARGGFDYDESLLVLAGHYRRCSSLGCDSRPRPVTHPLGLERLDRIDLPAGDYRLYLINDGTPASLTIRLKGVHGEVRLPSGDPAAVTVREPEVQLTAGGVHSVGQTERIERSTLAWNTRWFRADPSLVHAFGTCVYDGRPPVPEEAAYLHTCHDLGASGYRNEMIVPGAWLKGEVRTFDTLRPGTHGHGMYVETTSPRGLTGSLNVMVGY